MAGVRLMQWQHPFAHSRVEIPNSLVEEVFDYLLNTRGYHQHPDAFARKVTGWRRQIREAGKETLNTVVHVVDFPPAAELDLEPENTVGDEIPPLSPISADEALESLLSMVDIEWLRHACRLRVVERLGYRTIAERIDRPKTTVRRGVIATLQVLGIENPDVTAADDAV